MLPPPEFEAAKAAPTRLPPRSEAATLASGAAEPPVRVKP